jgi:hypothetical protein
MGRLEERMMDRMMIGTEGRVAGTRGGLTPLFALSTLLSLLYLFLCLLKEKEAESR